MNKTRSKEVPVKRRASGRVSSHFSDFRRLPIWWCVWCLSDFVSESFQSLTKMSASTAVHLDECLTELHVAIDDLQWRPLLNRGWIDVPVIVE